MAKSFSADQWQKIHSFAEKEAVKFGLPKKRRKSVVLGSFNIRKLGGISKKSAGAWDFFTMISRHFDLLAIQEVQDNLEGLKYLRSRLGPSYGLVASDTTGSYPGESSPERLAFLYRWRVVSRTEVASDITYDRTKVSNTLFAEREDFQAAFGEHQTKLDEIAVKNEARAKIGKGKLSRPSVPNPHFIAFIRQPLCVSFEVGNRRTKNPYQFMAVNCHLLYGKDPRERQREFQAIIAWLIERARNQERMYYPNILFMGDCNLEFKNPEKERPKIENFLKSLNKTELKAKNAAALNFPFLDVHPKQSEVFRTAARLKDTYDQIAIIFRDGRLPDYRQNKLAGKKANGYDYGVFNFVEMFAQALHQTSYHNLAKKAQKELIGKFEHDLTDHLPIWIRLPMPD